jgi:hypothetical protein
VVNYSDEENKVSFIWIEYVKLCTNSQSVLMSLFSASEGFGTLEWAVLTVSLRHDEASFLNIITCCAINKTGLDIL